MVEVTGLSRSLAGTAGAVSVEELTGLVASFLLKKLPKMELLLVDFGADSRTPLPAAGSMGDVAVGSTGELLVLIVPVAAVSPLVTPVVPFVVGSDATAGSTGDPMTRAAEKYQSLMKQLDFTRRTNAGCVERLRRGSGRLSLLILRLEFLLVGLLLGFFVLFHLLLDSFLFSLFFLFLRLFLLLDILLLVVFFLLRAKSPEDAGALA